MKMKKVGHTKTIEISLYLTRIIYSKRRAKRIIFGILCHYV